jgi:hypothetical protein
MFGPVPRRTAFTAATFLALLAGGPALAQKRQPSPHFRGDLLPEPPAQRRPWQYPNGKLPQGLVTATAALFKAGLADPRGCEYRTVTIALGSCWSGDAGVGTTHAWVLPARPGERSRFAVCWNGLVYPVLSVRERADLRTDVLVAIKAADAARLACEKRHGPNSYYRFRHAWPEGQSVAHRELLPIWTCLLLRLGEDQLARRAWQAWTVGMRPGTNNDALHLRDPYLMLATDWTWALFDRAVCAHMRGDDRLALLSLRALLPVRKAVTTEALRRGFKEPAGVHGEKRPLLSFLDPSAVLLADQERRARERAASPAKLDPKSKRRGERIAALVRSLEDVDARQWGQPGGISLNLDWTVQALIKEGPDVVGPLLDCLEHDNRLTRAVGFGRDFFHHRRVVLAAEPAFEALCGLLGTSNFGPDAERWALREGDPAGRKKLVAAVRGYWKAYRGVAPEERWYRILRDDSATPEQWLEAAAELTRLGEGNLPDGDRLRRKKAPSVAELMARRVGLLGAKLGPGTELNWRLADGCVLASYLARWDRRAALPVLRAQIERCRPEIARATGESSAQGLARVVAQLFLLRAEGDDERAIEDYATWVRTLTPAQVGDYQRNVFELLWRNPDHPTVLRTAAALFAEPASAWAKSLRAATEMRIGDFIRTPLLGLRSFRAPLLAALADKTPVGTVTVDEGGESIRVDGGWAGGTGSAGAGPLAPIPGTPVRFRRCDLAASILGRLGGLPPTELYWPEAERDRAVAECARVLRHYGDGFRPRPDLAAPSGRRDTPVFLSFPPRSHPATFDDVLRGNAIFSLGGTGKVRRVGLPAWPLAARWVTLKKYPYLSQWVSGDGKRGVSIRYDQDGFVWQAEEVFHAGKWRRYYGFVGPGAPVRVPAEEIEFPAPDGWAELSGMMDCRLEEVRSPTHEGCYQPGKPVRVRLQMRNRAGVARMAPTQLARPGANGAELRTGLKIEAFRLPPGNELSAIDLFSQPEEEWERLEPRRSARFRGPEEPGPLQPAGERVVLELDMRDWFDLSQAGSYAVRIILPEGQSNLVTFMIGKR